MKKVLDRFDDFITGISKRDKVAILHDYDPDGVCSSVLMSKLLKKLRGRKHDFRMNLPAHEKRLTSKIVKDLKNKKVTKLITCDISFDECPKEIKAISKFADICVIDHHKIYDKIDSENVILIKPDFFSKIKPYKYPTTKMVYDIASRHADMSEHDWIACIGLIADAASPQWPDFLKKVYKKHNIPLKKNMFESELGILAGYINDNIIKSIRNAAVCFNIVYAAKDYKEVMNSKLKTNYVIVEKELWKWVNGFEKKSEKYGDLYIYEVTPKYNVKSPISTILGGKFKKKTILVVSHNKGKTFVSGRRGDFTIPMNDLLEECVKGFKNANAGGHIPASGATMLSKDYKVFKQRVLSLLKRTDA